MTGCKSLDFFVKKSPAAKPGCVVVHVSVCHLCWVVLLPSATNEVFGLELFDEEINELF